MCGEPRYVGMGGSEAKVPLSLCFAPHVRACLKIARGPAARDFGCGQGGEAGASPERAVTAEPTPAAGKRPAARRVFAEKAGWLRCSSVEDPPGIFSFVAPCHPAFSAKTGPLGIFRQALIRIFNPNGIVSESRWDSLQPDGAVNMRIRSRLCQRTPKAGATARAHGVLACAFSAASMSAHDGARQRCSTPGVFMDPRTLPSGENAVR